MSVKLYVEGGGDSKSLRTACRKGFRTFLEQAGAVGRMPRIVACGSRANAYESFQKEHGDGVNAMLLVDAEEPVESAGPWQHLSARDGWELPSGATDEQCHLMVQVMESWFLADADTLSSFYGQGFRRQALAQNPNVEGVLKHDVLASLARATRDTGKGIYNKGTTSFAILEKLDPAKVRRASPYADRFIRALST